MDNNSTTKAQADNLPVTAPLITQRRRGFSGVSAMTKGGPFAATGYMATSVLLVMLNKAALSSYSFPCANVITLFQMLFSCAFLYAMKHWRIISFIAGEPQNHTSSNAVTLVPLKTLYGTLPLALTYLLYMLLSMESVRSISVPMYTTLRRTTLGITMIVEYLLVGQKHSPYVISSVIVIIIGAFVAGARDLSFDAYGYTIVFMANICTAVYLASIARIGKSSGLNSFGLMWCNGIICLPVLLLWTLLSGDLEVTLNFPHLYSTGFQAVLLLSCSMAFLINYFVFSNTILNSALTQAICGNLKDLFTIGLGWLLFGGLPFDFLNVVGQSISFFGSCLYAYYKLKGK